VPDDRLRLCVSGWTLRYEGFDPATEGRREALCTLGNGVFATRGAAPEARADGVHYPGTYLAGCFNRLVSEVEGRRLEHESLVNVPNWLALCFRIEGGAWFAPATAELLEYRQELDLRRGLLTRRLRYADARGRRTLVTQRRLVSMADPRLAALETTFEAEGWDGVLEVRSGLDGRVANRLVRDERLLGGRHLEEASTGAVDAETVRLETETVQSRIRIVEAARTRVLGAEVVGSLIEEPGLVEQALIVPLAPGEPVIVEKVVALASSRDVGISEPGLAVAEAVAAVAGFEQLAHTHAAAWAGLWDRFDVELEELDAREDGEAVARVLRLHTFHLLQTASPHTVDLDAGLPARGLHGEGYRGHIFWDEAVILPALSLRAPAVAAALLRYRHRRLPAARRAAAAAGHRGAMFPWQSGSDGRDETPTHLFNARSGRWMADNSRRQRHVGLAVAYNAWHHYQVTGDREYLAAWGAELIVEVARSFASMAVHDPATGRYDLRGVMGPDEFHDGYPEAPGLGVDGNAYTNVLAAWTLWRAEDALAALPEGTRTALLARLGVDEAELAHMNAVSRGLRVVFHRDGVISQFAGYEELAEFDWEGYRARYGNIGRLDLILEAEGDSPNRYRLAKQPDVLMLLYLLSADELRDVFARLGYELPAETIERTVAFYLPRTSHGSTLAHVVDSWVQARWARGGSWHCLLEALASDVDDVQGGTTPEGIHLGAMAGSVDIVTRCWPGLDVRDDVLWLNPLLPLELQSVSFGVTFRGHRIHLEIDNERVHLRSQSPAAEPVRVGIHDQVVALAAGEDRTLTGRGAA
jgi:trehalose/maltose hydrolase-like predicted phosphorylase